jgi:alpha-glucosidase
MNRLLLLSTVFLISLNFSCTKNVIEIESPSSKLVAEISVVETGLKLELFNLNKPVVNSNLGNFVFDNDVLGNGYQIERIKKIAVNENWKTVYGEKSVVQNNYNEIIISLTDKDASNKSLRLICRAYDEGIAFRYQFDSISTKELIIKKELTNFTFDGDYDAWVTGTAQGVYKKEKISKIDITCERPLVIQRNDTSFIALGEAALVDYARMKFTKNPEKPFSLQVILDGEVNLKKADYITPWRYVMVAESPAKLLENNYFVLNLNEPNKLEDVSWIKPGKIIREVTLTTRSALACVDFANRHNLQYVEFDAGWYGNEYDDLSDATTITVDPKRSKGPLDLHKVTEYAESKGIGIILYVNRRALEKQLDEILPLYKSWGIKGLKYGFVNVGPQEWTSWLHDAVQKAAGYQLMVDIHDEYRPTGYSRTYPNLMTQEGIRGDEESPSVEHTLITLFTRMIAGAADNTNCYSDPRVKEKMGGKTAQMAKAIMLYSPWQFVYWYDRPVGPDHGKKSAGDSKGMIVETGDLEFYDTLPTVWDDTKVLDGKIGEYATIARKSGDSWFVGTLVANQTREIEFPLTFLDNGVNYKALIFFQNNEDLKYNKVSIETVNVNQHTTISRELYKNSGIAVIINKI